MAQTDITHNASLCLNCSLLNPHHETVCARCGTEIHQRKPHALIKTWAFALSALFFIIPANLLPMMITTSLGVTSGSTIMAGIIYFFEEGSYGIGLVILVASVLIPLFKLLVLFYLLILIQFQITGYAKSGTKLFHIIHFIGKWSMIDIFVVALMVAAIQFGELVTIDTGPAAISFTLAVVMTMIATINFDLRLLWDIENDVPDLEKKGSHEYESHH